MSSGVQETFKIPQNRGVHLWFPEQNKWLPARPYQTEAFGNIHPTTSKISYNKDGYKFQIERDGNQFYGGLYFIKENGAKVPIINGDVKIFLLDQNPVDWYPARNYQKWAYSSTSKS